MSIPFNADKCFWEVTYTAYVTTFDIHGQGLSGDELKAVINNIVNNGLPWVGNVMMHGKCRCCNETGGWAPIDPSTGDLPPLEEGCPDAASCPGFKKEPPGRRFNTGSAPMFGAQVRKYEGTTAEEVPECPKLQVDPVTGEFYYDPACPECCEGGFAGMTGLRGTCPWPLLWEFEGVPESCGTDCTTYTPLRDWLMTHLDSGAVQDLDPIKECITVALTATFCPPPAALAAANFCRTKADETENLCNTMTTEFERQLEFDDPTGWISKTWAKFKWLEMRGLIPYGRDLP